jgi:hypothetical protein
MLLPIVLFTILATLGMSGGLIGILLLILLLPPIFRFQMLVLEAAAKGVAPEPLDAENFSFAGSAWALFPLPLVIFITWATVAAAQRYGESGGLLVLFAAASLLPVSLSVLVITRSPLQSLNPVALMRLIKTCGATLWIASVYLVLAGVAMQKLVGLPMLIGNFAQLVLTFGFFSLTGTLVGQYGVVDDVYIPDDVLPDDESVLGDIEKHRAAVLGHAYGFISRDNREGGFRHVFDEIEKDQDPVAAWDWYFNKMLGWENQDHAMFFAQHYVHDALQHGEDVRALKAMMRCRMISDRFKPFQEDLQAALRAAEKSGNTELGEVLRRG